MRRVGWSPASIGQDRTGDLPDVAQSAHRRRDIKFAADERYAGFRGRPHRRYRAVRVPHAGQARGREPHRQADHRRGERPVRHGDGDALTQFDRGEISRFRPVGALRVRTRVRVIAEHERDAPRQDFRIGARLTANSLAGSPRFSRKPGGYHR